MSGIACPANTFKWFYYLPSVLPFSLSVYILL